MWLHLFSCGHAIAFLYCNMILLSFQVLGVSFSPNGYLVATGSEDNFCRIWDLRTKRMLYSIPAHKSLISHVKFEPQEGYYLATSSYDTKAAVCLIIMRHLFYFFYCLISDILPSFCSCGQLVITNQSRVWWPMSQRLLVWILVEVTTCLSAFYLCCM